MHGKPWGFGLGFGYAQQIQQVVSADGTGLLCHQA